jgi:hypothetical protein
MQSSRSQSRSELLVWSRRMCVSRALCVCTPSHPFDSFFYPEIIMHHSATQQQSKILSFLTDGVKFISWPRLVFYVARREHGEEEGRKNTFPWIYSSLSC